MRPLLFTTAALMLAATGCGEPESSCQLIRDEPGNLRIRSVSSYEDSLGVHTSNWDLVVPWTAIEGLKTLDGPSVRVKFAAVVAPGRFLYAGTAGKGQGEGRVSFEPDLKYAEALRKMGYRSAMPGELYRLAMVGVTLEEARQLREAGVDAEIGDLPALHQAGIDRAYVNQTAAAGLAYLTAQELLNLKQAGVAPAYALVLKAAGCLLGANSIAKLSRQAVPQYIPVGLKRAGYDFTVDQMIDLHRGGLTPTILDEVKARGKVLSFLELAATAQQRSFGRATLRR